MLSVAQPQHSIASGSVRTFPPLRVGAKFASGDAVVAHMALRVSLNICCILYFGANLSVPPSIAMSATGALSIGLIATSSHAKALASRCWPLFAMCAIAMLSALWSVDPSVSIRRSLQLIFACSLGVALVGRLGSVEAVRSIIRAMSFACALSVLWVVLYPTWAIHQATDSAQTVHAGLWRGIFSHKVNYSMFAGLTLGLLLFYGRRAFKRNVSYVVALASALAGLIGSGSATGAVVALTFALLLHVSFINASRSHELRRKLVRGLVAFLSLWIILMTSGALNQLAALFGRSTDLTGRSTYWPFVMSFLHEGSIFVGYGYAAGFRYVGRLIADRAQLALGEAHNGYIEMLVAFGYLGGVTVIALHILLFWQAVRLLHELPARTARIGVLPLATMTILLMTGYIESVILAPAGIFAVLLPIIVAIRAQISMQILENRRRWSSSGSESSAAVGQTIEHMPFAQRRSTPRHRRLRR